MMSGGPSQQPSPPAGRNTGADQAIVAVVIGQGGVGLALDADVAMEPAVVEATVQGPVVHVGGPAGLPGQEMVDVTDPVPTAREAAAPPIPDPDGPALGDRPGPRAPPDGERL